ncbi:MAG: AMP-binding protein [Bdellovibrionales bacterium]|nr:AMP-binding protein [Bdellovibrionales bacterium]
MEKIWQKHYQEGVPHEINPSEYSSVVDILVQSCNKYAERPAFASVNTKITFKDLNRLSADFAAFLQKVLGLKKGDRIAIQMPNLLQYPVVMFGAIRAGLVVVNINPLYTAREMKHQFVDSGAKAIVILANFAHNLEEVIAETDIETVVVTQLGDLLGWPKSMIINAAVKYVKKMVPPYNLPKAYSFYEALDLGGEQKLIPEICSPDDIAFLQYTGGTTGVSKGAMLTHRNILCNMLQIAAWMRPQLVEGREIVITPLPLYHIFSLTVNCLTFMYYGGTNVLVTNPRDIGSFIKLLRKTPFTILTGVNTLFNSLLHDPEFDQINFKQVKISVAGGMALQKSVALEWKKRTHTPLVEGYGLTESSPVASCNPIDGSDEVGSIGMPLPSTRMQVIDDNGEPLPQGQAGELVIYGPQVMKGYWQRPEETANVIMSDGGLRTGDIAVMNEKGYFKIVDRLKDMILVSGFNVYPNEIEDVVASHPKVLEAAAVGVKEDHSGEAVKIFVVKKDSSLTPEELLDYCRENLVAYKVPRHIEFRTELPKTNVGKILRRALRTENPTPTL